VEYLYHTVHYCAIYSSPLSSKTIVVTGGASGIGEACVHELVSRGATIWVADITPNPPASLAAHISSGNVHYRGGVNTGSREHCTQFMDEVVHTAGRIDGLLNNAGIGLDEGPLASDEVFEKTFNVNVRGVFNFGTHAIRVMKEQEAQGKFKTRGVIVNTASGAALRGVKSLAVYVATKHAVLGLTRAWAEDFSEVGIRINAIAPGATETPAFVKRSAEEPGFAESLPTSPAGRNAKPEEIATVVAFLFGDDSSYIFGQIIPITGGS